MNPFRVSPCGGILASLASLAAAAALLGSPGPAWSQETAAPVEAPEARPQPIPGGSIPDRAQATLNLLTALRDRLDTLAPLGDLPDRVDSLEEVTSADATNLAGHPLKDQPLHVIGDLDLRWERRQATLDAWGSTLTRRTREILEIRDRLLEEKGTWEVTRQAAVDRGAAPALIGRVETVIQGTEADLARADEVLAPAIELQERVEVLKAEVAGVRQEIERTRRDLTGRLFTRDQEPLWRILQVASPPSLRNVADAVALRRHDLADYLGSRRQALVLQGALFLLVVALLRSRRLWSIEAAGSDPGLRIASHLLERPWSAACAIALLATPLLYPAAPNEFTQIVLLLTILPFVRLLPLFVPDGYASRIYALAGVFLLYRIERAAPAGVPAQRLLLLVATCALIGWVATWRKGVGGRSEHAVVLLARVATAVLAVAVVADLVGAVSLSTLLSRGTAYTLYAVALLYAAGCALDAFLAIVGNATPVRQLGIVRRHPDQVTLWRRRLVGAFIVVLWIRGTLRTFLLYEPVMKGVAAMLSYEIQFGNLAIAPGDVLAFVVAVWMATIASRLTRTILQEDVLPRFSLPRGVPATVSMLAHYSILILGFLIAVSAAGLELSRLAIVVGALGVGIGFGLQSLVNNFVSGLVLIFERPISPGDAVQVGATFGTVSRIGSRASVLRTFDGAEVIIPNGTLISGEVINWTLSDRNRRLEVTVGVAYGTDPERVLGVLLEAAKATPRITPYPKAVAFFKGFGESSLDFSLRAWTAEFDDWIAVQSDLALAVHRALREAGCEIPFPQRDLHIRTTGAPTTPAAATGAARDPEG